MKNQTNYRGRPRQPLTGVSGVRLVLARNVRALLTARGTSESALAKSWGLHQGMLNRASNGRTDARIESIDEIAKAFGLQAWQLLVPSFDPHSPPRVVAHQQNEAQPA